MTTVHDPGRSRPEGDLDTLNGRREAVLAGLALFGLIVGVPAALLAAGGAPALPAPLLGQGPTSRLGAEQLVAVLVLVAWLAWVQFVVCTVVEVAAAVRGGVLARPVPLSGPSQRLARLLIGSLLLSTSLVVSAGATAGAVPVPAVPVPAVPVPAAVPGPAAAPRTVAAPRAAVGPAPLAHHGPAQRLDSRADDADLPPEDAELVGRRVYVVHPPEGRNHESMWEIAQNHLGDGRRYREIFRLNEGRPQPDGRRLDLARLIQPGWHLIMPEDAVGVPRHRGSTQAAVPAPAEPAPAEPAPAEPAPRAEQIDPVTGQPPAVQPLLPLDPRRILRPTDTVGPIVGQTPPTAQRELLAAGLLSASLLAGLALIRLRRGGRRPGEREVETEVQLRVAADGDRGALLELALRSLPGTCTAAGRPLPQAHSAVVGDDAVDLLLTVAHGTAPAPWSALDGGRGWRLERHVAGSLDPTGACAYPLLVGVGRDDTGRDVLLNLGAAAGAVTIVGDPRTAAETVRAMTLGLAANPWSRGIDVLATGVPAELPLLSAGRVTLFEDNPALATELLREGAVPPRTTAHLLGGPPRPGTRPERVAVFGAGLDADTAHRVRPAVAHRSDVAALAVGDLDQARWNLRADRDGRLSCAELGLRVTAHRLGDATLEQLHGLVEVAPLPHLGGPDHETSDLGPTHPFDPGPQPRARTPEVPTGDVPGTETGTEEPDVPIEGHDEPVFRPPARERRAGGGAGPAPARAVEGPDDDSWAVATTRIALLGDVEVRAPGPIEANHRAVAEELVAFLALHRAGVHPSVLGAALWPLGVTPDVRKETVELARAWLGQDVDGGPILRDGHDGRLRLSPRTLCDWDVARTLLERAEHDLPGPQIRDLLRRALGLVRGPVIGGVTFGAYSWLPRTGLQRQSDRLLVRAANHLATLAASDGDHVAAAQAAAAGLRAVPSEQELWRHVIRAEHGLGGPARLRIVVEQMRFSLAAMEVDLDPRTAALVEHLAADASAQGRGGPQL